MPVVKPCARREAAARRAPSVAAGGKAAVVDVAAVKLIVWVLIPLGAKARPQSPCSVFIRVGSADRF